MEENSYKELKGLAEILNRRCKEELDESRELVDYIIKNKCKEENIISHMFDKMLSILFIDEHELKSVYYKLIDYTKEFNKELADDYERFFLEQFEENEDC